MKEINKRDLILIISIILIVTIATVIIIVPKKGNENETNNLNNNRDVVANSPASPEELFSRPFDTELPKVEKEVTTNGNNTSNLIN